jgi:hypothetical protein
MRRALSKLHDEWGFLFVLIGGMYDLEMLYVFFYHVSIEKKRPKPYQIMESQIQELAQTMLMPETRFLVHKLLQPLPIKILKIERLNLQGKGWLA